MRQKKRGIGVLLVVAAALLAVASALHDAAAAAPVFDSTVLEGYKYTTATGDNFSLVSPAPRDKVVIDLPGESLIVENKSCSAGRRFQACYKGAAFKGYNHTLVDREVYEFKVTISLVAPEIKVAKILDKAELDVADSTVVRVNITNTGSAQGTVFFTETVPGQLKIIELPDQPCQASANNTLIMAADIKVGEIMRCDYKVTALAPGTYALASAASYDVIKRETATAAASLAVKPLPLLLNETVVGKLLLGEPLNISISLRPSSNLESFVFNAFIPAGIRVVSVNKEAVLEKDGSGAKIVYGGRTTALKENATIRITSQAEHVGSVAVSANASWLFGKLEQEAAKDIIVNVTLSSPYLRLVKFDNGTGEAAVDVVNPAHLAIYGVNVIPDRAGSAAFSANEIGGSGHASFTAASGSSSYNGAILYHTAYGQELAAPFSLAINSSGGIAVAANGANVTEASPPEGQREPDSTANATGDEIIRREKQPKRKLMPTEVKTALVMVGMIIMLIAIFLVVRGRRGSGSGEDSEDAELKKLREYL